MTMNPFSLLKRNRAARLAEAAERRDHDLAVSDPRLAVEHYHAIERAADRGESGCMYYD